MQNRQSRTLCHGPNWLRRLAGLKTSTKKLDKGVFDSNFRQATCIHSKQRVTETGSEIGDAGLCNQEGMSCGSVSAPSAHWQMSLETLELGAPRM